MKLDLAKFMQSMPKGAQVEDPEDPRLKRVNEVLKKQGLYYDPKRRKVMQIEVPEVMKGGPMKGASVVPEEAMRDYLRNNGLLETSVPMPTKRANLSEIELRKKGFRKDPKSGDIFPINL
jgi:hypothetical protein